MTEDLDYVDSINYVADTGRHGKFDQSGERISHRPVVKAAKKLGIMGQIATQLGLKNEELDSVEALWRETEFAVRRKRDRLLVEVSPTSRLEVTPGSIAILGTKDDMAIEAGMAHAHQLWGGRVVLSGSEEFKVKAWAHAQIAGVEVVGYEPPREKHAQAYQEVLRLVHASMQEHGITELSGLKGPYDLPASGFIREQYNEDANREAYVPDQATKVLMEKARIKALLGGAELIARTLPLSSRYLPEAGFIDDEPAPVRASARIQPKGP